MGEGKVFSQQGILLYSLLVYNGKVVGVRFDRKGELVDVSVSKLGDVDRSRLTGLLVEEVRDYNGVLISEQEYRNNAHVKDGSNDESFVIYVRNNIVPIKGLKQKMRSYKVRVDFEMMGTNGMEAKVLYGDFEARTEDEALEDAHDYYVSELGDDGIKVSIFQ